MAKAKAKSKGAVAAVAPRRSWFWLQGMACGAGAVAAPGTALMLTVLLAPGLCMFAAGPTQGRPIARAMLMMGAATAFMPLRLLWEQGGSVEVALGLLSDPGRPLLSWIACGASWLSGQITEMTTRFALDTHAAQIQKSLNEEKTTLLAEWMDGAG